MHMMKPLMCFCFLFFFNLVSFNDRCWCASSVLVSIPITRISENRGRVDGLHWPCHVPKPLTPTPIRLQQKQPNPHAVGTDRTFRPEQRGSFRSKTTSQHPLPTAATNTHSLQNNFFFFSTIFFLFLVKISKY